MQSIHVNLYIVVHTVSNAWISDYSYNTGTEITVWSRHALSYTHTANWSSRKDGYMWVDLRKGVISRKTPNFGTFKLSPLQISEGTWLIYGHIRPSASKITCLKL